MNKRGIALILGFTVIVVLTILGGAIISKSISERNITNRAIASTKAFWAAEAGLAKMAAQLPNITPLDNEVFDQDYDLRYIRYSTTATIVPGFSNRWTVTSTGRYTFNETTQDKLERKVVALVEKSEGPNVGLITNAIETTGTLDIRGSVDIEPDDSYLSNSTLSFQSVFGMDKESVKALADRIYTNPSTNQQPINGITWVDLTGTNKYVISSNWSGEGLLIVNGNGTDIALDISGGWSFAGVIWVIGKLSISGTSEIGGAIFAESAITVENTLTGNAEIEFDGAERTEAFNLLTQKLGANILSWQEQEAY